MTYAREFNVNKHFIWAGLLDWNLLIIDLYNERAFLTKIGDRI